MQMCLLIVCYYISLTKLVIVYKIHNILLFFAESGSRKLKDEPLFKSRPGQPLGNF